MMSFSARTFLLRAIIGIAMGLLLFATSASAQQASDQQETEEDSSQWGEFVDPDGDCRIAFLDSQITIRVPDTPHDLSAELQRMNAPRLLKKIDGDFTLAVIVKGEFAPGDPTIAGRTAYNGAGLLVMQDEDTYIRLERAVLVRGGRRQHYVNFELRSGGRVERIGSPSDMQLDPEASCLLRIERVGGEVRGIVRQGSRAWTELEPKSANLDEELQVGIAAINASSKPFEAEFSGLVLQEK